MSGQSRGRASFGRSRPQVAAVRKYDLVSVDIRKTQQLGLREQGQKGKTGAQRQTDRARADRQDFLLNQPDDKETLTKRASRMRVRVVLRGEIANSWGKSCSAANGRLSGLAPSARLCWANYVRAIRIGGLLLTCAFACAGQSWEIGAAAGYGLYHAASVYAPDGKATAGIRNRFTLSGVLGQDR